ncbi:MAG: transposase [Anaerolineae bacterium]|nr:transposase [Anaerolineae bacterium]
MEEKCPSSALAETDAAITLTTTEVKAKIEQEVGELITWVLSGQSLTFFAFETQLVPKVLALGGLFVQLFLCMRHERFQAAHTDPEPGYKQLGPHSRLLGTFFGKVRYGRTYFHSKGKGYYPLDVELGLTGDGFSMVLRSYATRLATKVSYAQAALLLTMFLRWSPVQESIEGMVLGLGQHTGAWFESAPAPEGDGEVLIVQIDSKATPTATEAELEKRRGKRAPNPHPGSQRHRGRAARQRRGSKKRRQKGDKAKNGKMATIVTMYTLKQSADGQLEGPINKKVYASYAPKRHAVAIARREANKRGFGPECGKLIQVVTDGDNDLERYIGEYFPEAEHTTDVYHVTEYLWEAGECLYKEGSAELNEWVEGQKEALYAGRAADIVAEVDKRLAQFDPGRQSARERLEKVRNYIAKRVDKMNYKQLRERDLEISSGAVEGAVNYVIARRFDCGGMRWIKERAEHLLQLRCIEVNDDWDAFIEFVHDRTREQAQHERRNLSLKCTTPAPLPTYGLA